MDLESARVVMLVEDGYEDLELWYPYYRLQEAGAAVCLVGPRRRDYRGKHGYVARADHAATDLDGDAFDGIVVPGGHAPDRLRRHEAVLALVRAADANRRLVGAICHGGSVLVSADILRGRRVTSYVSIRDDLRNAGATWIDAPVVRDGHIVTSRHPGDLPGFARTLIEVLGARHEPVVA